MTYDDSMTKRTKKKDDKRPTTAGGRHEQAIDRQTRNGTCLGLSPNRTPWSWQSGNESDIEGNAKKRCWNGMLISISADI